MFDRRSTANQQSILAAGTALVLMAGIFTAPALAATQAKLPCLDATEATLEVPVQVLVTEFANNAIPAVSISDEETISEIAEIGFASSSSLLAPRAEAAIRDAFSAPNTEPMAGTEAKPEDDSDDDESAETDLEMNAKLPGISDDDFLRYKKQMYRRDI
jgi:hypothetical protein